MTACINVQPSTPDVESTMDEEAYNHRNSFTFAIMPQQCETGPQQIDYLQPRISWQRHPQPQMCAIALLHVLLIEQTTYR